MYCSLFILLQVGLFFNKNYKFKLLCIKLMFVYVYRQFIIFYIFFNFGLYYFLYELLFFFVEFEIKIFDKEI